MLRTKFQTSRPSGSEDEALGIHSMHFYGSNLGPLSLGPSPTLGPWFE